MAELVQIEVQYLQCPRCNITMQSPETLVVAITYPDDLAEIDQLLRGELNTVQHRCGARVLFGAHLTLYHPARASIASTMDLTELLPADALAQLDLKRADGNAELVDVLYGWVWRDAARAMTPDSDPAALFAMPPSEFFRAVGPIALLAAKVHRDGALPIMFAPGMSASPERANEVIRELGVRVTVQAIQLVVELLVEEGRAEDVVTELAERVPVACVDEVVLESLSRTTQAVLEDDGAPLLVKWRAGVACAAAHAEAGLPSSHADAFVVLLFALWNLGKREGLELDPRVWLSPETMRRLVEAESVLALLLEVVAAAGDSLESVLVNFTGFSSAVGHDDTVAAALGRIQVRIPQPTDVTVAAMIDAVVDRARVHAEREPEHDPWDRGFVLAGAVWGIVSSLPLEQAVRGLDRARESLARASVLETYGFDCAICQRANRAQRGTVASRSARFVLERWGEESIGPEHALFGVNEAGNALRLIRNYEGALKAYEIAEGIDRFVRTDNSRTIRLNRAIILRDLGDFVVARALLDELVESDPDDFVATESLAVLHWRVGEYPAAFSLIDRTITRAGLAPEVRRRFVRLKGFCCAFSGDAVGAVEHLGDELEREPVGSPLRLTALAALQRVDSDDPGVQETVERAAQEIAGCAVESSADEPSAALVATALLALRRVRGGDRPAALRAFELCLRILGQERDWPWQVELVYAWLCTPDRHEEAVEATRRAVTGMDGSVPTAEQAEHAMTWMGDQDVTLLQSIATQLAISDPGAHVRPDDVLAAFDLQNGRELTSLAARSRPMPKLDGLHAELARNQAEHGSDVVAILDSADECSLLILPLAGKAEIVPLAAAADVAAAVLPLSYPVNPLAPETSDVLTRPWWKLAETFAEAVRERLPASRPLVILDGSRLVSTPLHAAGWPAAPLIFERPVSFAVNARLLVSETTTMRGSGRAALACPKQGDSPAFVEQLESTGRMLREHGYDPTLGVEVDEAAMIAALGEAEEVILLCHGVASVTADEGPGICVAAGGTLPPSALMVDHDASLHAFVVTWRDLMNVESTPETLISLACSSGRTRSGRGGTRIGLDQALFGRSTSHLISPVWNVGQTSALHWLEAFVRARAETPVHEAYRAAVIEAAREFPHPYHWAPFTLRSHHLSTPVPGGIDGPVA